MVSLLVFPHAAVFSELYCDACKTAISNYTVHGAVQVKFLSAIRQEFESVFDELDAASQPSAASSVHVKRLQKLHGQLASLKSHKSCFCCLMRMPEKVLGCGHALCDVCIKVFGTPSNSEKYSYTVTECVLCGAPHEGSSFRFVPPTAGVRILSLDGGGVRGVIPLTFLARIEEDLFCPLREHFDFVCGTSAGESATSELTERLVDCARWPRHHRDLPDALER
mgnify:CR=1 FL=1